MSSQTWMRPALTYLFEQGDTAELQRAVHDRETLAAVRVATTKALPAADQLSVPAGDKGDNLLLALIALRLKFPRSEAERKLERNLQLRAHQ